MKRHRTKLTYGMLAAGSLAAAGIVFSGFAPGTMAQQQQRQKDRQSQSQSNEQAEIRIPAADGLLRISAHAPDEVRVGDSFSYQINVQNVSENIVLHNVKISQEKQQGLQIESARVSQPGQQNQQSKKKRSDGNQQAAADQSQQQKQQEGEGKQKQDQQKQDKQKKKQKQQSGVSQSGTHEWTISELRPGETRTIHLQAASDNAGQGSLCLSVTSWTPALCLQTTFVKPELDLVKVAPENAGLCEDIEVAYYVENTGTADLKDFEVEDKLADGLQTVEGEDTLKFTVDGGLEAGETRKFVATLRATRAGEFSSRAVAVMPKGKKVRSSQTTTTIEQADLAVQIDGPGAAYLDRPLQYTVRVTNHGNIPAKDARVELNFPNSLRMARMSDVRRSDQQVSQNTGSDTGRGATPTPVDQQTAENDSERKSEPMQQASNGKKQDSAESPSDPMQQETARPRMAAETVEIGNLDAGATREFTFTLRGSEGGMLKQKAIATHLCGDAEDRTETRTVAMIETEVISLPALAIYTIDEQDPVRIGDEFTYKVIVKNEGTAPDQNVTVKVDLPDGLEFVEASGDSEVKSDSGQLNFAPVKQLEPGKSARWTVRVKAGGEGNVLFGAELTSDNLQNAATAEEPTRLIKTSSSSN